MGNWYRVTKRIHGRIYDYWQRTFRVGKTVKTENKYIGPSSTRHVVRVDPTTIAAPRTLAQSTDNIITVNDMEQRLLSIENELEETARMISGGLSDHEWHQAQNTLTALYAERRKLEETLNQAVTHHLETTLLPKLKALGVVPSTPSDQYDRTAAEHRQYIANGVFVAPPPEPEPVPPEYTTEEKHEIRALQRERKKAFDAVMRVQNTKVRQAKHETKGIRGANPFMAKLLKKTNKKLGTQQAGQNDT